MRPEGPVLQPRVPAAHDARHAVREQRLALSGHAVRGGGDGHILAEQIDGADVVERPELDRDIRRRLLEHPQQRCRHHGEGVVGCGQPELPVAGARIEHRPQVEGAADLDDGLTHHRLQRQRARGEVEGAAVADQQRIVEELAQLGHRAAHRRLGETDGLPGTGEAAFGEDGIEHDDEVDVDAAQIIHALVNAPSRPPQHIERPASASLHAEPPHYTRATPLRVARTGVARRRVRGGRDRRCAGPAGPGSPGSSSRRCGSRWSRGLRRSS